MSQAPPGLVAALHDRYAIERKLGEGGMATVYLAHDVRHDRKVALKVLRPEVAAVVGAERFLAEIRTTANLQHPHILPLHDSGNADGLVFFVMPYVAGESLRDLLRREKQLPVDDAIRIACEVAEALDYAHRHGVIHRDIKPENVMLHEGRALVTDFGIALAVSGAEGGKRMTETGLSLGTPYYMSPEQAMGEREITPKSDVYALGCVLYEMLAGEPPFTGPTAQAVVGKMLSAEPEALTARRRSVPAHVETAVLTALEKLPADRFASAAEFGAALGGVASQRNRAAVAAGRWHPARPVSWLPWTVAATGTLVGLFGIWISTARDATEGVTMWDVALPDSAPLALFENSTLGLAGSALALSPDGDVLVYVTRSGGSTRLRMHRLSTYETRPLPGTEGAFSPFFSPDGRSVAFFAGDHLKRIDLEGSSPETVTEVTEPLGGAWLPDGRMVVGNALGRQLSLVSENGGMLTTLGLRGENPQALPGGRVLHHVAQMPGAIAVTSLGDGVTHYLTSTGPVDSLQGSNPLLGSNPLFLEPGYLLYFSPTENSLLAVELDLKTLTIRGEPVRVLEGVRREINGGQLAASASGRVAYVEGGDANVGRLVWGNADGRLDTLAIPAAIFGQPSLSPDRRRLAIPAALPGGLNELRLYELHDLSRGVSQRLANSFPAFMVAEWSPDGGWLAMSASTSTIRVPLPLSLGDTLAVGLVVRGFTADGLAVAQSRIHGDSDIATFALGSSETASVVTRPADQLFPQVSPNGKWIAYTTSELGRWEVVVEPFPMTGVRRKVSLEGGEEPRWSPRGDRLFYRYGDVFYDVDFDQTTGDLGVPAPFVRGPFINTPGFSYDVSEDGHRLLLILGPAEENARHVRFISSFGDRLTELVKR